MHSQQLLLNIPLELKKLWVCEGALRLLLNGEVVDFFMFAVVLLSISGREV